MQKQYLSLHASGVAMDLNAPHVARRDYAKSVPLALTDEGLALVEDGVPPEWIFDHGGEQYVRPRTFADVLADMQTTFQGVATAMKQVRDAMHIEITKIADAVLPAIAAASPVALVTDGQVYPKDRPRHVSPHGPAPRRTRARR